MLALNLIDILIISGAVLVGLLILGMILARLYKRATKEVSLDGAIQAAEDITNGQITGRVVIKL